MIDWADTSGETLLTRACHDEDVGEVDKLLAANANPLVRTQRSPLEIAVEDDSIWVVELLLSTPQLKNNTVELNRTNVLHNCDDPDIAQMLLDAKADPAWHDNEGRTALVAAVQTSNTPVVEVLLATAGMVGTCEEDDHQALENAVWRSNHACLEVLLCAKAHPSIATLEAAVKYADSGKLGVEVVARLINAKVDPSAHVEKLCITAIKSRRCSILSYMLSTYGMVSAAKLLEEMACNVEPWHDEDQLRIADMITSLADIPSMALDVCGMHGSAWLELLDKSAQQSEGVVFAALLALSRKAVQAVHTVQATASTVQVPDDCRANICDLQNAQHLMVSAWKNNKRAEPIVQALINFKVDPNGVMPSGRVPVECDAPAWFEQIVASPCCKDVSRCNSLRYAVLRDNLSDHLACMAHYLPVQVHSRMQGVTPLWRAVYRNCLPAVQLLLDSKANIDRLPSRDSTHVRICELLDHVQWERSRKRKLGKDGGSP